jgi:Zn-dependent protease with chaperone function
MTVERLDSAAIRRAFSTPPMPVPATAGYRLRLLSVMASLLALQALYLALVFFIGWLIWEYFVVVPFGFGAAGFSTFLFWLMPPAAGIIVLVGLMRPLVRKRRAAVPPLRLKPEDEPVLFEFVEHVCSKLNAPKPSVISVNLSVNAFAGVAGWKGFFTGKLELVLGLPLATGLSLPQLAGVIAHEFGHFSQRAGMRSQFLFLKVQEWFMRTALERDGWDMWLDERRNQGDFRLRLVAGLGWLALFLSREYLKVLAKAARWVSVGFSRQMEFDADRHETAIVGPEVFEQTTLLLPQLIHASSLAGETFDDGLAAGRMTGDIPGVVAAVREIFTQATIDGITEQALARTTGRWDDHPCDAERIASARSFGAPAIFTLAGPASLLFQDLPRLCREATRYHLEHVAEIDCGKIELVAVEEAIARLRAVAGGSSAVADLFHCSAGFVASWLRIPGLDPMAREEEAKGGCKLNESELGEAFRLATEISIMRFAGLTIKEAGVNVRIDSFHLHADHLGSIKEEQAASLRDMSVRTDSLNAAAQPAIAKIETALAWIGRQQFTGLEINGAPFLRAELKLQWMAYGAFSDSLEDLRELRRVLVAADLVRANGRAFPAATCANLLARLASESASVVERIKKRLSAVLAAVPAPSEAGGTARDLELLVTRKGDGKSSDASVFLGNAETLREGLLARLAGFTSAYEAAVAAGALEEIAVPPADSASA